MRVSSSGCGSLSADQQYHVANVSDVVDDRGVNHSYRFGILFL